jgi:hypothetical protein
MFWFLRMRVAIFGGVILFASVGAFVTYIQKQTGAVETRATLLSRFDTCQMSLSNGASLDLDDARCEAMARMGSTGGALRVSVIRRHMVKLRYEDQNHNLHWVTTDSLVVTPADAEIGETVTVRYDPAKPDQLLAPGGAAPLAGLLFVSLLGLIIVAAALKLNPVRLLASAGVASVRLAGAGREGGPGRWTQAADEAIARAAAPPPPPMEPAAYGAASARSFGRRAASR